MLHREGHLFLIVTGLILALFCVVFWIFLPQWAAGILTLGALGLYIFLVQFFKNPDRPCIPNDNTVVSPADGKVVSIDTVIEKEYFMVEMIKISIFLSPLNVHCNRIPVNGRLVYYQYHPGKYLVAFHPKSSELNERNTSVFKMKNGTKILTRQIAGAVARRIKFYHKLSDEVTQGEELGFIKFGSRVDVFLPLGTKVLVKVGDKVKGAMDTIAKVE
jgi:phosphatidylserine decarboxylase